MAALAFAVPCSGPGPPPGHQLIQSFIKKLDFSSAIQAEADKQND